MQTEFEAKFLGIEKEILRNKLQEADALLLYPEVLMQRVCLDFPDKSLRAKSAWVRLRREFDKITLTYKVSPERTIDGTKEIEVEVSDFDQTRNFLKAIGMVEKSFQETKREEWILDGVHIMIDEWPWIPPFIEIEGESTDAVQRIASKLGFDWKDAKFGSVEIAYQEVYDVTVDEVNNWKEIKFIDVPEWLIVKKHEN
jgi:adenylate cyclase class 2